jgi:hypothetical protein
MIILKQAGGLENIREALLNACLCNLAYDRQCESERSEYLARLIVETGDRAELFSVLIKYLEGTPDEEVEIPQIFAVLARLAGTYSDLDAPALRRAFSVLSAEDQLDCMDALIRLDGLPALLQCAERLIPQLSDEGWRGGGLFEVLRERDGAGVDQVLLALRATHPSLDQLMSHVEAFDADMQKSSAPGEAYDFSDIRATLRRGKRPSGSWLWKLTEEHWALIAEDLVAQIDDAHVLPYLRLFARRPFPHDPQRLVRWADSHDRRVSWAAILALGRVKAPVVRSMALQRLEAGDESGVRLLLSNYAPGDFARIEPLLRAPSGEDQAHDLGLAVLGLISENDILAEESREPLLLVYACTPCSMCRGDAVSRLAKADQVPVWMAEECRFDADPDTVKLFNA